MNVVGPKDRATFSIARQIKSRLEKAVPKSERSRFVERAIDKALQEGARERLKELLDQLPRSANGENSTEFLRRKRLEWDGRPIHILEGRDE